MRLPAYAEVGVSPSGDQLINANAICAVVVRFPVRDGAKPILRLLQRRQGSRIILLDIGVASVGGQLLLQIAVIAAPFVQL